MNKLTKEERADWRLAGMVLIVALIAMVLALLFAKPARADVNLPAICTSGGTHGSTACDAVKYDYPAPTDLVRIATTQYFPWGGMKLTSTVVVCASDVTRGATSCPQTIGKLRSELPAEAPVTGTFAVTVRWDAPTQWADGTAMPDSEVIGYRVQWFADSGGAASEITLPASARSHALTLPSRRMCIVLHTQGKVEWSDPTESLCIDPKPAQPTMPTKPGAPANVTVTFGSP